MKLSLSIKALFRTPLKTLLTFLLLAATSYMLFSSAAEYTVTAREFKRAAGYYQGIGMTEVEEVQYPMHLWGNDEPLLFAANGTDYHLNSDPRVPNNPYEGELDPYIYKGFSRSDIDAISSLPYVTGTSTRYMTAGVVDNLNRTDARKDYYNYTSRFVFEATFQYLDYSSGVEGTPLKGEYWSGLATFADVDILAGNQDWIRKSFRNLADGEPLELAVQVYAFSPDNPDGSVLLHTPHPSTGPQKRYHAIIQYGPSYYNEAYSLDYLESLVPGERYIVIGRFEPPSARHRHPDEVLSDSTTIGWWPQIYPLNGQPDNYIELDEFEPLREMIKITNDDLHTFDVVYTDDMSSIYRFSTKDMIISSGRMLNAEDNELKRNVCVLSQAVMNANELKIGDTVALKLGDKLFEQNAALGAVASVRERYPGSFTEAVFEIVGAYTDVDTKSAQENTPPYLLYSENTIFVPSSFLQVEVPEDYILKPGEFSFIIGDANNISSFLEGPASIIKDSFGYTLFFSDGGWLEIERQVTQAETLTIVRLPMFSVAVLLAICLTVYLFIERKRKEYAIMRALGTTGRSSNRSLYIPLGVVAVFALIVGTVLAHIFSGSTIENALAVYTELGIETDSSIPVQTVLVCLICEFAALILVTAFGLRRIGSKAPLELLQEGVQRMAQSKFGIRNSEFGKTGGEPHEPLIADNPEPVVIHPSEQEARQMAHVTGRGPAQNKPLLFSFFMHYIIRHIRRAKAKSLLSAGLALLLLCAIGQFTVIRGIYKDLYENFEAKVYFTDELFLDSALELGACEYLRSPYIQNVINDTIECNFETATIVMTNDVGRYSSGSVDIEFLEGYDSASISVVNGANNSICVLESGFMDKHGIELGDTVGFNRHIFLTAPPPGYLDDIGPYEEYLTVLGAEIANMLGNRVSPGAVEGLGARIAASLWFSNMDLLSELRQGGLEDADLYTEYMNRLQRWVNNMLITSSFVFFTVVGRYTSESAMDVVFVPVGKELVPVLPVLDDVTPETFSVRFGEHIIDYVEYTLTSPAYADEFRDFIDARGYSQFGGLGTRTEYLMNTHEADNMFRVIRLLDALYPIAVVIAALMGCLFPGLTVMQAGKEASLMRALGTTKNYTRSMLVAEQALLCGLGLLCAVAILLAINGVFPEATAKALSAYAVAHLAMCIAGAAAFAVVITRRRVLELLQVKE